MKSPHQTKPPWKWQYSFLITLALNGGVLAGVPLVLIWPVYHHWPRAFVALGLGLLPAFWSVRLLRNSNAKAEWLVGFLSGVLAVFWLVMSVNLAWMMIQTWREHG